MSKLRNFLYAISIMAVLATSTATAQINFTDNFDDGSIDDWSRFDLIGAILGAPFSDYSFPDGGVRMTAPPTPDPAFGFVSLTGMERRDITFRDFSISVDVVNRPNLLHNNYGVTARLRENSGDGYLIGVTDLSTDTPEMVLGLNRLDDFAVTSLAFEPFELATGAQMRILFSGEGDSLTVQAFDLADLSVPLATVTAEDGTYPTGYPGIYTSGSGPAPGETDFSSIGDATFDDYTLVATIPEPAALPMTCIAAIAILALRRGRHR